jgi:hypothetical protein
LFAVNSEIFDLTLWNRLILGLWLIWRLVA